MTDTKDLVFVSKDEYIALVSKAAIYDAFARKLKADKDRGGYISEDEEYEHAMFIVDEPEEDTEDGAISDEVWEEIEAMVEKKEENDGTETV